jgi:hypothetical protein
VICIDVLTESKTGYLIDVVNQKIKIYQARGDLKPDNAWIPYKELKGSGKIGTGLTIIWDPENHTHTPNITELKFTT